MSVAPFVLRPNMNEYFSGVMGKMYGAATMVGKDEMNGRVNPALEADDDIPPEEVEKLKAMGGGAGAATESKNPVSSGGGGTRRGTNPAVTTGLQGQTSL